MKRKLALHKRTPAYRLPRNTLQKEIYTEVQRSTALQRISYAPTDKLELVVCLYIPEKSGWHKVDNRLRVTAKGTFQSGLMNKLRTIGWIGF